MPVEVLMPALSPTMETGKLSKWLVNEGDRVEIGDVIAEIETDKATMEIEAIEDGQIEKLIVPAGPDEIEVNTPIALIASEDETIEHDETVIAAQSDETPEAKLSTIGSPEDMASIEAVSLETTASKTIISPPIDKKPEISESENSSQTSLSVREALRDAMAEEMRRDIDVFIMGEEVAQYHGAYKVTQGLLEEFGSERVIDTPITEYGFAGVGCGAAMAGLKPVVEFMTFNFAMQAIDHIVNTAAKTLYMSGGQVNCSIVFRGPNGAASRVAAQHSQDYSAWYAHVPGLKVIAPFCAADAKGLLKSAIRDPNPVVFLENELLYGKTSLVPNQSEWLVPIGKANILHSGADVTIVSYSKGLDYALGAREILANLGIEAEIIDLRTLRPLDMETVLRSVRKTNRLVTVEESWPICSIGTEICSQVTAKAFDFLDAPPLKVTSKDVPMPYAENLEKLSLPSVDKVVQAVKRVCYVTE